MPGGGGGALPHCGGPGGSAHSPAPNMGPAKGPARAPNWNGGVTNGGGVCGLKGGGNIGGPVKTGGALKGAGLYSWLLSCLVSFEIQGLVHLSNAKSKSLLHVT